MNYHFKQGNRKEQVLQQLQLIEHDLMKDKKNLAKLQLEAEFYQDKGKPISIDKQNLADEIMNQLINDPSKPMYNFNKPQPLPPPVQKQPLPYSPPKDYAPRQAYVPQVERQNNLVNERELQKMKLQNQKHQGLFPNSSEHNRVKSIGKKIVQQMPEKDRPNAKISVSPDPISPKKAKSPQYNKPYDPGFNPFAKDETLEKQKKQQKNRQYLRDLQKQRQQQQRKKKALQQEQKQFKNVKNEISKPREKLEKSESVQKPLVMKRSDPNGQPPKIQPTMGNYSQFDKGLVRSKLIELKSKYKKGKIDYEEYQIEFNKLRKQYPGDIDEIETQDSNYVKDQEPPRQTILPQPKKTQQDLRVQSKQNVEEIKYQPTIFPIRNQSINYSQFMPSMVQQPYVASTGYPQNQPIMPGMYTMMPPPSYFQGAPPAEYMELLKKMFDFCFKEVKEVRTEQSAQNQVLQQTLNKVLTLGTQPTLLTQQLAPIPNQLQRQFYSDAKQHRQYFEKESNIKKKVMPSNQSLANIPFGESDNSEYYDKSLSGIASKIPLNQVVNQRVTTRENEKGKLSALDQFYIKKYKIKPFKKFDIFVLSDQSNQEIPSTSSYFRAKNAKEDLKNKFEEDLSELKKIQKAKNTKKVQAKVISNAQYSSERRFLKDQPSKSGISQPLNQQISPISKQQNPVFNNPYLKMHIATEDNMLTFNNKQLKVNSPTGFTPISKKQILQQDEYLTEPKIRQQIGGAASLINEYEEHLAQPVRALNFLKIHNQVLSKYDKSQSSKRQYITIKDSGIKEISSRDYFVNNQISPVKPPEHYEQSLQTIRSDFQSVKQSNRYKVNSAKFQQSSSNRPEEIAESRPHGGELDNQEIIQTVESVEQSSSRFRKPPIAKRRSVGKKKESSISRSKNAYESNLSFSGTQQVEQSMGPYPKFDSNVYESNYEESIDAVRPNRPRPEMVLPLRREQNRQAYIELNPPTIITPKNISPVKQPEVLEDSRMPVSKQAPQNKWKSLEEARKLAKEGRNKGEESKDYRSVQQKFSELQSFMTKKVDDSQHVSKISFQMVHEDERVRTRGNKSRSKQKSLGKKDQKKRNIMKLLQQLQDDKQEEYKQQFESYREQSEQYQ